MCYGLLNIIQVKKECPFLFDQLIETMKLNKLQASMLFHFHQINGKWHFDSTRVTI